MCCQRWTVRTSTPATTARRDSPKRVAGAGYALLQSIALLGDADAVDGDAREGRDADSKVGEVEVVNDERPDPAAGALQPTAR